MSTSTMHGPIRHRACVWHRDPATREKTQATLSESSFEILATGDRGTDLVDWVCHHPVDLVVTGDQLEGISGIDALLRIASCKQVPSVMIVRPEGLASIEQLLSDHVMSFLTEPLRAVELVPSALLTLRRFTELQRLKETLNTMRLNLADAKVCYLAKCRMIQEYHISEPEAHQRLQRLATDGRIRLAEAASRVLNELESPKDRSLSHAN